MNDRIYQFKQELNRVFDDNLHTKQWHNWVDYAIIGLIILSTLEVFASTFTGMEEKIGGLLKFIDIFTTVVFTIEVTLRIWCADLLDDKYKGFLGRVRYCFSFYGLIDILSTYPFYVSFFFPIPYTALKVLRIARLLRVFRYAARVPLYALLPVAFQCHQIQEKRAVGIAAVFKYRHRHPVAHPLLRGALRPTRCI